MTTSVPACVLSLCLAAAALAQQPGPGLTWAGTSGGSTGSFVPQCLALPVAAVRGETVTLRVWGDPNSVFVLAAASSATQCLPLPGLGNGLVLDLPVFTVAVGTLTQTTPCLSCPPGLEPLTFALPAFLPPGTTVAFQAVAMGANMPACTTAIAATVR